MTGNDASLADVLAALNVPRSGVVYVQSSMDWIQRAGFELPMTLKALTDWVCEGTLVMPSYPFTAPHIEYLQTKPVYDVRRTPARVGLLAEVFRRVPGVTRSLAPDYGIAALGPAGPALVSGDLADDDPFGATSSYRAMLDGGSTLLGLGVSLNTNSFIHAVDSMYEEGYGRPVYFQDRLEATVIDETGQTRRVLRRVVRPEFQRLSAPGALAAQASSDAACFSTLTINGALFFRWDLTRWAAMCRAEAAAARAAGRLPVWLHRLEAA